LVFFGRAGVPGAAVIVLSINANLRRLGKRVTDAKLSRCGMMPAAPIQAGAGQEAGTRRGKSWGKS
jgi:hypothetical protein